MIFFGLMKLSPLFIEICSFETVHCLNFNTQCQKRHDVNNDMKVNLCVCGFVRCMKNMLFLANILVYYPEQMCNCICRNIDTDPF